MFFKALLLEIEFWSFWLVLWERQSLKDQKSNFGPLEIDFWFLVFLDFWESIFVFLGSNFIFLESIFDFLVRISIFFSNRILVFSFDLWVVKIVNPRGLGLRNSKSLTPRFRVNDFKNPKTKIPASKNSKIPKIRLPKDTKSLKFDFRKFQNP